MSHFWLQKKWWSSTQNETCCSPLSLEIWRIHYQQFLNMHELLYIVVNINDSVLICIPMNMWISPWFFHRWAHPLDHCQGLARAQGTVNHGTKWHLFHLCESSVFIFIVYYLSFLLSLLFIITINVNIIIAIRSFFYHYIYMSNRQNYCNTNLVFDAPFLSEVA